MEEYKNIKSAKPNIRKTTNNMLATNQMKAPNDFDTPERANLNRNMPKQSATNSVMKNKGNKMVSVIKKLNKPEILQNGDNDQYYPQNMNRYIDNLLYQESDRNYPNQRMPSNNKTRAAGNQSN